MISKKPSIQYIWEFPVNSILTCLLADFIYWIKITIGPSFCMNFFLFHFFFARIFFLGIFPCMNFFLAFSPPPPPPITFLMVRPLAVPPVLNTGVEQLQRNWWLCNNVWIRVFPRGQGPIAHQPWTLVSYIYSKWLLFSPTYRFSAWILFSSCSYRVYIGNFSTQDNAVVAYPKHQRTKKKSISIIL